MVHYEEGSAGCPQNGALCPSHRVKFVPPELGLLSHQQVTSGGWYGFQKHLPVTT